MKTSRILPAALLAAGLALGFAGCAQQPTIASSHRASPRSARTFALSVTTADGSQLTGEQWSNLKASFQQQLAAAGYTLVDDVSLAERIIYVVYSPTIGDPANGTVTVMRVRDNPAYAFNQTGYGMPTFASYNSAFGYNGYNSLYGAGYFYDNYYGSSSTVVTPRHDQNHNHNRPNQPDNCQPGDNQHNGGGQYAHHDGNSGSHHGPGPSDAGNRWGGASRLDSGSSGFSSSSYSGYSSGASSYSGPTSSSYSSSSNSLPSASFGGGSSSSYSPSSSSYSSGSSSFSSGSSSDYSSSSSSSSFSSGSSMSSGSSSSGPTTSNHQAN